MDKIIYPRECSLVPLDMICTEGRSRKDFGDLQELAESIQKYGLFQPPFVTEQRRDAGGTKVTLVGGERRLRAMQLLGVDPVPVLFREEMTEAQLREAEFFENEHRKEFTWQERACNIYLIHRLRVAEAATGGRTWSYRDTRDLTRNSLGHISHSIQAAKAILSGYEEVVKCPSLKDAYTGVLLKRAEAATLQKLSQFGIGEKKTIAVGGGEVPVPTQDIDDIFDDGMEIVPSSESPQPDGKAAEPSSPIEVIEFPLSEWFFQGDSVNDIMLKLPDGCVDHVVTDPMYAVEEKNLEGIMDVDTISHDMATELDTAKKFLKESYRLLKDNGYCIFWYDIKHQEKLMEWAQEVGYKVQEWPLVWHKMHKCRNNVAQYNWTKNTEYAMVCRKGSPTLTTPQMSCIFQADGSIERQLYSNPYAKPAACWEFILSPIGLKGQTILDPFAGQMSCPRTVLNMGMKPLAIELEEFHFQAGIENIKLMLNEMTGGRATFK